MSLDTIVQPPQKDRLSASEIGIMTCVGLILAGMCCLAVGIATWLLRDYIPGISKPTPTATPSNTPTPTVKPQILVHAPEHGEKVVMDDFSPHGTRDHDWQEEGDVSQLYIYEGQLELSTTSDKYTGVAWCTTCGTFQNRYYIQADLGTEDAGEQTVALAFDLLIDDDGWRFNAFVLNQYKKGYELWNYSNGEWKRLTDGRSPAIRKFPAMNTLSVYVDGNRIELYINGEHLETYAAPENLPGGNIGFISSAQNKFILADNLFAYQDSTIFATFTPIHPVTPTPTLLPDMDHAPTVIPNIMVHPPLPGQELFIEDFARPSARWKGMEFNEPLDLAFTDGAMVVTGGEMRDAVICVDCPRLSDRFYIQADLTAEKNNTYGMGIIFSSGNKHYLFYILTEEQNYGLEKDWSQEGQLIPASYSEYINHAPATNTLGVYFDRGHIELYINGHALKSAFDSSPLPPGYFGIENGTWHLDLYVDNVIAYELPLDPVMTPTLTPAPATPTP